MKNSELVEQGTHEALLAQNGVYAEVHRIQNPEEGQMAAAPPARDGGLSMRKSIVALGGS